MIIARFTHPGGKMLFHGSVEIEGSPAEERYRFGGWFPVNGYNFGFKEKDSHTADKPDSTAAAPRASSGRSAGNQVANKNGQRSDEKDFSGMNISKDVDMATCELMVLAMEERSKKKGAERGTDKHRELHVDIHVLASFEYKDSTKRHIFPSLMIHLEAVRVTQWSIDASGDDRPSESIQLEYDRAAMQYIWTDGRELFAFPPRGWDQDGKKREDGKPGPWADDAAFSKFRPVTS